MAESPKLPRRPMLVDRSKLHRARRKNPAESDQLTPMMRAIKAVHSVTSSGSTNPDDLERQRAGQELFGRLVSPTLGLRNDPLTIHRGPVPVPAEWVSIEAGHDRRHAVL